MAVFDDRVRELLDGKNFAVVATLDANGAPHTSVVWIGREDDTVVFSSTVGRKKVRNLIRDGRVSLTVWDAANPYHTVDVVGVAQIEPDPAKDLPKRLSHKYLEQDPPLEEAGVERVIVRVIPSKVTGFSV
ncbi:PPOX class F420-dependent oxidoreductase [Nocardia huaxiensis]|uniref:PPOX class F420-dependent oxidoreductase n=1 Tax=Nocardia huaxiensis TaxID=2755382 RepID=A0A7D6VA74_9NOCA|nr:PPOX class F420-dependent oxidoreductase [Nocardia huaxiensis]QLY30131.1 PPOX class F420-dependent oxidoreductase [Nocardia huaxiensis]